VSTPDVIDHLVGIAPGSPLDAIRAQRPEARENAQRSYLALFEPEAPGEASALERYAVASYVARLHRAPAVAAFYAARLADHADIADAVAAEAAHATTGPYGRFPPGPLSAEDMPGAAYRVGADHRPVFGARLTAAIEHADLLVFHPRDASPQALQDLLDAGWSTTGIVTLSQLVAFLAFQIRVIAGLKVLAATPATDAAR
jgi:CMD domain protein